MEEDVNVLDLLQEIKDIASGKIEKSGNPGNDEIVKLADQAAILVDGANEMLTGRRECGGKPSPLPR